MKKKLRVDYLIRKDARAKSEEEVEYNVGFLAKVKPFNLKNYINNLLYKKAPGSPEDNEMYIKQILFYNLLINYLMGTEKLPEEVEKAGENDEKLTF